MRILYCSNCHSLFNIVRNHYKSCECGETSGRVVVGSKGQDLYGLYTGAKAVPIEIDSKDLVNAIKKVLERSDKEDMPNLFEPFTGFALGKESDTMNEVSNLESLVYLYDGMQSLGVDNTVEVEGDTVQ